jgi:hypothetical protein
VETVKAKMSANIEITRATFFILIVYLLVSKIDNAKVLPFVGQTNTYFVKKMLKIFSLSAAKPGH